MLLNQCTRFLTYFCGKKKGSECYLYFYLAYNFE
jgi:hypothetical protein